MGDCIVHWQHVTLGTRCSWLHGDRRGFRDRGHRTHSSGHFKNPPPETEHAGTGWYYEKRSGKPVDFDLEVRVQVCREFLTKMLKRGFRIISCSVGLLPGNIWSQGGEFKRINDAAHLENAYNYIRIRQEAGTVVWSHKVDEDWIKDESIGVVTMGRGKTQTRVFKLI